MITFDPDAHGAMIELLHRAAAGNWTATMLKAAGDDLDQGVTVRLEAVDHARAYGTPLNSDGELVGGQLRFDWTEYERVHLY